MTDQTAAALAAAKQAQQHGIDLSKLPQMMDLSPDSITDNVVAINSGCPDERMKFIMERTVRHLHDLVRETSLTTDEWMATIQFLTKTGQMCSDIRQEFILLSDVLGVSALVDTINNAKPPAATEATVLGPFFTEDAAIVEKGASIASEGKGDYMWVEGRILDTKGNPIANAQIDTWETDENGLYDTQYSGREMPDCRGRLYSAADGTYAFRAVVPVPYPIPSDGPVGGLIRSLGRHSMRPAHLHMMIEAEGFENLTTALYFPGDPYLTSDAVFGVKASLVEPMSTVDDVEITKQRGFKQAKSHKELKRDFILATKEEGNEARRKAMPSLNAE